MATAYLLLGSNLGDKYGILLQCLAELERKGMRITKKSSVYQTSPWGYTEQPIFLNQAIEVETTLTASECLIELKDIETLLGRKDLGRWMERLIDIDIIYFESQIIDTKSLIIPHPEMHNRRFVLVPLLEIAEDFIHPIFKKNTLKLLQECPDPLNVERVVV